MNLEYKALVKAFKLPIEPYPNPFQIGQIKKGLAIKVTEICKIPLAIGKHYIELVLVMLWIWRHIMYCQGMNGNMMWVLYTQVSRIILFF